ncbi:DNA-binding transcriptional regulator GbsR (MarR family) [Salibacterium salarium]|uniref:GbsR/MarR family transcriptional regulator n=1 Tax=Salibacterium salarium TaxID=284579 RepID=UPI0027873789|nr:transcriptional regulator [Salibacterium salarium]MDQ0298190.1 DNA-binding transcriptional regulator GbsR (MarR family) [Salibacterium salarium]
MSTEWDKLEEARDVMESAIAQSMVIYGVTPSVGRIYGILYFANEPLSIDDITVQVAMSKASVSNGLRELIETEMVTKVWKKGERKDHFIAEKDFLRNFLHYFVKKIRQERNLLMKAAEQTKPTIQEIAQHTTDEHIENTAKQDLALIKEAQNYLDWTTRLANALESKEILDYVPPKNEE